VKRQPTRSLRHHHAQRRRNLRRSRRGGSQSPFSSAPALFSPSTSTFHFTSRFISPLYIHTQFQSAHIRSKFV
jgi:hypothetical protein